MHVTRDLAPERDDPRARAHRLRHRHGHRGVVDRRTSRRAVAPFLLGGTLTTGILLTVVSRTEQIPVLLGAASIAGAAQSVVLVTYLTAPHQPESGPAARSRGQHRADDLAGPSAHRHARGWCAHRPDRRVDDARRDGPRPRGPASVSRRSARFGGRRRYRVSCPPARRRDRARRLGPARSRWSRRSPRRSPRRGGPRPRITGAQRAIDGDHLVDSLAIVVRWAESHPAT